MRIHCPGKSLTIVSTKYTIRLSEKIVRIYLGRMTANVLSADRDS